MLPVGLWLDIYAFDVERIGERPITVNGEEWEMDIAKGTDVPLLLKSRFFASSYPDVLELDFDYAVAYTNHGTLPPVGENRISKRETLVTA